MKDEKRFTLLPFPQSYDGDTRLDLRVVVLPRNQNPLLPAIEGHATIPDGAAAFADAQFAFEATIISGLNNFPYDQLIHQSKPLPIAAPARARDLFLALKAKFQIKDADRNNKGLGSDARANLTVAQELSVRKYLPVSYRSAFNFTTPRTRNAVIDDSYRCAVRDAGPVAGFPRSPDWISWGKVFAYALKQRLLAEQLGMIYHTHVEIDANDFPQGGWLYIDLAAGSDYEAQQLASPFFISRYAARIPALKAGEPRQVFAPILFPVLFKEKPIDPDPTPDGNYNELFLEAAAYDDGFAKIVHAQQPHSRNLLEEESDGAHPVKDVGIRLGWDDEQILIWYMRQMMTDLSVKDPLLTDPAADPSRRLDAPLGVFGYAIDVREVAEPENPWDSLTAVDSKAELFIDNGNEIIPLGDFDDELPYQVYPVQLDGNKNKSYWLPMYFANWNGHSMVLPDDDAARIYHTTDDVQADPTHTKITGPAANALNDLYDAGPVNARLRYGGNYDFRVRLLDMSGGGASIEDGPINETQSNVATRRFLRYVAPHQPRIADLPINTDEVTEINQLDIQRPRLGYPAAVYTNKYADAVARLITDSQDALDELKGRAFGIPDPDVDRVRVTVEVQTLKMDNLLSVSGKESYVHLYTTNCFFPAVNDEDDYDAVLNLPIVYRDCPVLHTGDEVDLVGDLGLPADISELDEIVVPTARTIRLTIRAVCEEKDNNSIYYGLLDADPDKHPEKDVRYGQMIQVMMYKASENEEALFLDVPNVPRLQGIFLQPDPPQVWGGTPTKLLLGAEVEKLPDMIERLANQLNLQSRGLTLTGTKGERVQFGCSNRIRHVLAPEGSSITFSSKGDLMNHWLCCVSLQIDRDWTWDALEDRAFVFNREARFTHDDPLTETETSEVGDIEVKHTAPYEALENSQRNHTRLVFIDAVEPKNPRKRPAPNADKPRFPDTIEVSYRIETRFKPGHAADHDPDEEQDMRLCIVNPPSQVPRIVSAGLALSPYERNEKYSATAPRRRYLWVEFAEPIEDANDTYFARMLAYAPDQLISNNHPELFVTQEEPALPIDPEYIRFITRQSTNDLAGLNAMQPMEKAEDSDRHYLLPLPKNLHANADEIFGFFTYEFRVGHYKDPTTPDPADFVWSNAQGRYGRRLRVTGIQHPAPTLTCTVDRDDEKIYVSAPYAVAVFKGKNVTADPPRTQLWALLYAQVRQADNRDYRNILLDNKQLDWRVQIERDPNVNWFLKYNERERLTLKYLNINNWKDELDYANQKHLLKLTETERSNRDAAKYGTGVWSNNEVSQLLDAFALPGDSPLSVLVVEFLPGITNIGEHVSVAGRRDMRDFLAKVHEELFGPIAYGPYGATSVLGISLRSFLESEGKGLPVSALDTASVYATRGDVAEQAGFDPAVPRSPSPVDEALGERRILRTSPLTEVPFVCCTNC